MNALPDTTMLNPDAPIPLYRQLADLLNAQILAGDYPVGSRIPSEPQLAAKHGIGRPTIRQALDLLVRKGLLKRRRGSGTYVCEPPREVDLFSLDGTTASFRKKGLTVQTRILMPMTLKTVNDRHNPFVGQQAYCFSRLTLVADEPVLIEALTLHAALFAGIDRLDMQDRSLSAIAEERYYLKPSGGRQSFHIGYLHGDPARHLAVPTDMPVLEVRRELDFARTPRGVFSEMWCRTDRFVFSQTIGGVTYA